MDYERLEFGHPAVVQVVHTNGNNFRITFSLVKLPGHPVRTGQARRGFPEGKYRFNCAPSCLPVGRDPAYPAFAGRGTCRPRCNMTAIRRRKMEQKSSEKAKPKTKKVRFNLNTPKTEKVSLAGHLNGCVLVLPEIPGMNEHITLYQGRFPEYHL
jgi:hypothetical protein